MLPYRLSSLLASAVLVLGAALVPGGAFADDAPTDSTPTGEFTTADLASALSAAQAPTAAAARTGWIIQGTASVAGSPDIAAKAIYAVDRTLTSAGAAGTVIEAQHSGTYLTMAGFKAAAAGMPVQRALKALGKPHATWVFTPQRSLDLSDPEGDSLIVGLAPDAILGGVVDPTQTSLTGAPTRSVAEDGSTTYTFSATDLAGDGETATATLTIDPSGRLTAVQVVAASETEAYTVGYGRQHVTLPVKKETVTIDRLTQGLVLITLPRQVKSAAKAVARAATRRAHHHSVTVATINSDARKLAKSLNRALGLKVLTTKAIARGTRITGTNPYTHAHTTYTVTIAGQKAVVHKA